MESKACRGHAVCITGPFQSHIKAMLKFAKLLHLKGFQITFVNTEFIHKRLLKSKGHNSLDGFPNFHFEKIPDGLPTTTSSGDDDEENRSQDYVAVCENILNNVMLQPFVDLLSKLHHPPNNPVSFIVSDAYMPFSVTAAEKFGLPVVLFFPVSASCLMVSQQLYRLKLKDESCLTNEYLDTVVEGLPGMEDICKRDLLRYLGLTHKDIAFLNFSLKPFEEAVSKASAIVIHTFDVLEQKALNHLSLEFPNLFSIGPLQLSLNQIKEEDDPLNSIGYSLWKEETECFEWLDSKRPNSVIYVNFGSGAVITRNQFLELAMGLANSDHQFLWIIRKDLVIGGTRDFSDEFEVKSKGKCFLSSWCPQDEVLNHPSIGGFLTHCGWGSTIESISCGVPLICWPFGGDQPMNCRCICGEWKIGMEIIKDEEEGEIKIKRNEVEKFVRELMEGEKGKKLRNKAAEWKRLAEKAVADPHGSSFLNFEKLVNEILATKQRIPTQS